MLSEKDVDEKTERMEKHFDWLKEKHPEWGDQPSTIFGSPCYSSEHRNNLVADIRDLIAHDKALLADNAEKDAKIKKLMRQMDHFTDLSMQRATEIVEKDKVIEKLTEERNSMERTIMRSKDKSHERGD